MSILGSTQQRSILGGDLSQPPVPWRSNKAVTMAALGMLGAPTLDQGIQRAASLVPAGLDANTAWQKSTQDRMDRDKRAAAMSAWMRSQSGLNLSPEEQSVLAGSPEVGEALFGASLKKRVEPPAEQWQSLTDPAARLAAGIPETDTRPAQRSTTTGEVRFPGGGGTSVNVNTGEKLTEGQSKDVNYYSRGRYANAELTPQLEQELTSLPQSLWSDVPIVGNYGKTAEYQTAKRAASEFLAVILRKDTGAAVTPAEFALYGPMYLPEPGDTPQVVEAKRAARERALSSLKLGLGTARPLADEIDQQFAVEQEQKAAPAAQPGGAPATAAPDPLGIR